MATVRTWFTNCGHEEARLHGRAAASTEGSTEGSIKGTCRCRDGEDVVVVWAAAARQVPCECCLDQQGADFRNRQRQQLPWLPHLHQTYTQAVSGDDRRSCGH